MHVRKDAPRIPSVVMIRGIECVEPDHNSDPFVIEDWALHSRYSDQNKLTKLVGILRVVAIFVYGFKMKTV